MRYASRTDGNHRELFDMARSLGCYVIETFRVGKNCPDGFVYHPLKGWFPVEVKSARGKLSKGQSELSELVPVTVWRTFADVAKSLGVML